MNFHIRSFNPSNEEQLMKLKMIVALVVGLLFASSAFAKDYTVKMLNKGADGNFVFQPDFLKVQPGDTVTFEPTDPGHDSQSYLVPAGAKSWKGEMGKSVKVTFSKQGVYLYECSPHHLFGMLGVIQVGKATNKAEAEKAAKSMEAKQMMNKGRLDKLMAEVK
jgi:pseudoazurin